jgi:hypothetical protein
MKQEIQYMLARFPAYRSKILQAYQLNDEFRNLCHDFYSSALILNIKKHKVIEEKKRELGYTKVFMVLETEVLNFLE